MQREVEETQADAMDKAAASSSSAAPRLTVGKAMEASKQAAAHLAAKGLTQQLDLDPADGPSRYMHASITKTHLCEQTVAHQSVEPVTSFSSRLASLADMSLCGCAAVQALCPRISRHACCGTLHSARAPWLVPAHH